MSNKEANTNPDSQNENNSNREALSDTGTDTVPPFWMATPSALNMSSSNARRIVTMGWHPDLPDFRDRNLKHKKVRSALEEAKSSILTSSNSLPPSIDNSEYCSPVEDQGRLGSCTAQAVVGLMEYMMIRSGMDHIDGSRLFTYKVTRNLLGWSGDTGAYLRTAMKAVAAFGIPPERYWPYDISQYEKEPTAFLYSFAENFKSLNYARLDPQGSSPYDTLDNLKRTLAAGFCSVFGFTVYSSLSGSADIPFPNENDSIDGGHAVMAVGYDDNHIDKNGDNVPSIKIRNSWGTAWGKDGYGYLPYTYLESGLARDFWTSFKWDWLNTEGFD